MRETVEAVNHNVAHVSLTFHLVHQPSTTHRPLSQPLQIYVFVGHKAVAYIWRTSGRNSKFRAEFDFVFNQNLKIGTNYRLARNESCQSQLSRFATGPQTDIDQISFQNIVEIVHVIRRDSQLGVILLNSSAPIPPLPPPTFSLGSGYGVSMHIGVHVQDNFKCHRRLHIM